MNFHITLGFKFNDIHDKERTCNNIIVKEYINEEDILQINNNDIKYYLKNNYYYPKLLIKELKKEFKNNIKNIQILIDNNNYLGYIFKYQLTNNINDLLLFINIYDYDINLKYDHKNIGTNNAISKINQYLMNNNNEYRKKLYYFCIKEKK